MGVGAFLIAAGILIVPHDATMTELYANLTAGMAEGKRTIIAVGCIGIGLLLAIVGFILGIARGEANTLKQ